MRPLRRAGFNHGAQGELMPAARISVSADEQRAAAKLVGSMPCIFAVCVAPLLRLKAIRRRLSRWVVEIERHTNLPPLISGQRARPLRRNRAAPSTDSAELEEGANRESLGRRALYGLRGIRARRPTAA